MSAAPEAYPDAFNGEYWELYRQVPNTTDAGVDWDYIAIGYTHAGISPIDADAEEWSIQPSTGEVTQQYRGHREFGVEISSFATVDLPALNETGLLDADGVMQFHETWEGARVVVYDRGPDKYPDAAPIEGIHLPAFDPSLDELDFQQGDSGDINWSANVNGRPQVLSHSADPILP